jgi:hypothetical protein
MDPNKSKYSKLTFTRLFIPNAKHLDRQKFACPFPTMSPLRLRWGPPAVIIRASSSILSCQRRFCCMLYSSFHSPLAVWPPPMEFRHTSQASAQLPPHQLCQFFGSRESLKGGGFAGRKICTAANTSQLPIKLWRCFMAWMIGEFPFPLKNEFELLSRILVL